MSAARPNRCTGITAFVRGVIAASTSSGTRLNVVSSMSTSTGRAPRRDDGAGGRKERVGGGDDFVAGLDVEGHQREQQRVGAGGDGDRMADAEHPRHLVLEAR